MRLASFAALVFVLCSAASTSTVVPPRHVAKLLKRSDNSAAVQLDRERLTEIIQRQRARQVATQADLDALIQIESRARSTWDRSSLYKLYETATGVSRQVGDFKNGSTLNFRRHALGLKHGNLRQAVGACLVQGELMGQAADFDHSIAWFRRGLQYARQIGDHMMISNAYNLLGNLYTRMGELKQAEDCHRAALAYRRKAVKLNKATEIDIAHSFHNLGDIRKSEGRYSEAFRLYSAALRIKERDHPDSAETSTTYDEFGNLYAAMGLYKESLVFHERALAGYSPDHLPEQCEVRTWIAQCHRNLGNPSTALKWIDESIKIVRITRDRYILGNTLFERGQILTELRRYAEAEHSLLASLDIRKRFGNGSDVSAVLRAIARMDYSQGRMAHAAERCRQSIEWAGKSGNTLESGQSFSLLSDCLLALGDRAGAEAAARRAIDCFEAIEGQVLEPADIGALQETAGGIYARCAYLVQLRGQPRAALTLLDSGKARGLARRASNPADMTRLLSAQDQRDLKSAMDEVRRARRYVESVEKAVGEANGAARTAAQQKREAAVKTYEAKERFFKLTRDRIVNANPAFARATGSNQARSEEIFEVSQRNPDTLYLEYGAAGNHMILFTISAGRVLPINIGTPVAKIRQLSDQWRRDIRRHLPDSASDERKHAAAMYRMIFAPVVKAGAVDSARTKRLVIVADGPLLQLPFVALLDERGHRLIERFAISHEFSLGSLLPPDRKRTPAPRTLLCVADASAKQGSRGSVLRGEFGRLAYARKEAHSILGMYRDSVGLFGRSAKERAVIARMGSFRILHIATHGFLCPADGLRSALVLADEPDNSSHDGMLEAREIMAHRLKADLAVLSGCRTAEGEKRGGEGLLGLAWAFRAAGCPSIVGSQWQVSDESTASLMTRFYEGLRSRLPRDIALQRAMIGLLRKGTKSNPYYWAAFQLIGEAGRL